MSPPVSLSLPPPSRQASQRWRLGARADLWGVQRAQREAGSAGEPLVEAPGHAEWDLPHCLICETRPHGQDAHPPSHRRKGTF